MVGPYGVGPMQTWTSFASTKLLTTERGVGGKKASLKFRSAGTRAVFRPHAPLTKQPVLEAAWLTEVYRSSPVSQFMRESARQTTGKIPRCKHASFANTANAADGTSLESMSISASRAQ